MAPITRGPVLHTVYCTADAVASLRLQARAGFPREACGLLGGARAGATCTVTRFLPLANRDPRPDHFTIAAEDFAEGEAALRALGLRWLGFAHSHPDGDATLSAADRQLLWRGLLHCIVPVTRGAPGTPKAYWLDRNGTPSSLLLRWLP